MLDQTLQFGQVAVLDKVNVSGISRLRMQITEVGLTSGEASPSRPAWANDAVT